MSRRTKASVRPVDPDARYGSKIVSKFIARMMLHGKRATASRIFYGAMDVIKEKSQEGSLDVFIGALDNVKPSVEVKSRRVGGSTYQVPVEVRESRREALAMRWIINAARARRGRGMEVSLSAELLDAFNSTGVAFKKKEDTHRMAEANKAFSHYRW